MSDFETTLQNRLAHPQTWKEVSRVIYSERQVITSGYVSTVPTTGAITRATVSGHNHTAIAMTAENLTISTGREVPVYIDFADLAQTGYNLQQEIAEEMGDLLNEYVESQLLAQHASFTDVGDSAGTITTGTASTITVSASNVDDIIRAVKRIIRVANGQSKMRNQGTFIIWRPADFELLEAFVQANGFNLADLALKEGTVEGFRYMGVDHFWSNDYTANHLFAGVKKIQKVGILGSEYGKLRMQDFPGGSAGGWLPGTLLYSRVDYGFSTPGNWSTILLDINVA